MVTQVVDDLGRRRQAVRRAAGVADDVVGGRVVAVLVDAEDDRDVLALGRGADDDLLRAGVDVRPGLRGVGEEAGALEHDVDAQVAPRQVGRVALGEDLDLAAVDDDRRVAGPDVARIGAVGRVALEQERVHLGVDQVVDGDDLDVRGALDERLERLATDPAEAVDADAGGHGADLLGEMRVGPGAGRGTMDGQVGRGIGRGAANGSAGPPGSSVEAIVPKGAAQAASAELPGCVGPFGPERPETPMARPPPVGGGPCRCVVVERRSAADPEDLAAADRAGALDRRLAVLHRDLLGVLDFDLLLVLDAIGLGHVGSSSSS